MVGSDDMAVRRRVWIVALLLGAALAVACSDWLLGSAADGASLRADVVETFLVTLVFAGPALELWTSGRPRGWIRVIEVPIALSVGIALVDVFWFAGATVPELWWFPLLQDGLAGALAVALAVAWRLRLVFRPRVAGLMLGTIVASAVAVSLLTSIELEYPNATLHADAVRHVAAVAVVTAGCFFVAWTIARRAGASATLLLGAAIAIASAFVYGSWARRERVVGWTLTGVRAGAKAVSISVTGTDESSCSSTTRVRVVEQTASTLRLRVTAHPVSQCVLDGASGADEFGGPDLRAHLSRPLDGQRISGDGYQGIVSWWQYRLTGRHTARLVMPRVVGLRAADARQALKNDMRDQGVVVVVGQSGGGHGVIRQTPAPGSFVGPPLREGRRLRVAGRAVKGPLPTRVAVHIDTD